MKTADVTPPESPPVGTGLKIYFLPNLMTAGNLFCGFVALTKIVEADPEARNFALVIKTALAFILLACIFDLLDGRVARWGGAESPFGREFDSLADLISFGVAPAFLVHRIVLKDVFSSHPEVGWFIASIYLICGALRLARYNCLTAMSGTGGGKEFVGFPIPAAAALVASLTLLLLWIEEDRVKHSLWRYGLPALMLFLSIMMVSEVKYPTFKSLNLRAQRNFTKLVIAALFVGCLLILRERVLYWVLPLLFTLYLLYGFVRPWLPHRTREEIEEEEEEGPAESPPH
ncbi:CDP-diacylglycerol--serine O-phosphatidyltransferase [Fontisphaera persica]|uniref:CDP-diacylglycerol--serine O-phosphatidyltransferase n=1 Tax=Fontisphaera persica TaxID=2974023 RepID=UPI0024C02469|nr:CDP-diacylglycerol--serine O-phosphatidyltransferase [Fontisphaera persica]WCJ60271.1 CDP-diacylglycerol--serine O-phosphatidyltransferase [Fontisphaera persica]